MSGNTTLRHKVFSGVMWKGLERVCAQFVSVFVSIILARILMPDDYSIVSIAAIFFSFCNLFISSGLNTALIQKKDADILDYSTVFTVSISIAAILYVAMFFFAPIIAGWYHKELITPVIRVLALTFFVNAYKSILSAKISSDMEFRKFFYSTIIGTVISALVGITMAVKGYGVWALVAQQMTNSVIDSAVLTFTTRVKFRFAFSCERFRPLFSFGGKIFLASIISTIYDECRPLIVGLKFSTTDLAFYNKGQSFPSLINSIGNNTLSSALFPAMAKEQENREHVLSMTRRFMKLSSFVVFPMMLGMLGIAESFVRVVLTEKWLPIVPYMRIFSVAFMLDLIQVGNLQAIRALGRGDLILKMEIIKKSSYAVVIVIAVILAKTPLLLASAGIVTSMIATAVNTYPNRKLIGYGFLQLFRDLIPNLLPAALMAGIVLFMNRLNLNMVLLVFLQLLVGGASYILLCAVFRNENLRYLKNMLQVTP